MGPLVAPAARAQELLAAGAGDPAQAHRWQGAGVRASDAAETEVVAGRR